VAVWVSSKRDSYHRYPSREFGKNEMYFYTTRLLVFLAVTGGLAAAIVLSLFGELIERVFA